SAFKQRLIADASVCKWKPARGHIAFALAADPNNATLTPSSDRGASASLWSRPAASTDSWILSQNRILIRQATPADAAAQCAYFTQLSANTFRMRFMTS